jgi:hypothetical protein
VGGMSTSVPQVPEGYQLGQTEQSGWNIFAGIILAMNGFFAMMYGLAGILNDEVLHVGGRGPVILDFTTWGWVTLVLGALMTVTGVGILLGNSMARWFGVAFAFLSAIAHFGTISSFPLWGIMVIAIDITIIYCLTARWYPDF